jgi:hypothetical protein
MATTTRREALQWVGGAAASAILPLRISAQAPTFPKGAVIRTLFKDYAPEELAGGATLFHEHLSLGPDFSERFRAAATAVLAAQGAPPTQRPAGPPPAPAGADPMRDVDLMAEELRSAQRDGVAHRRRRSRGRGHGPRLHPRGRDEVRFAGRQSAGSTPSRSIRKKSRR